MPRKPKRPCRHPGCPNLSDGVYCEKHRGLYARENAHRRGYGREWRMARDRFLRGHPLCAEFQRRGKNVPATVVDHIIQQRGDQTLFWDLKNTAAISEMCKKSADPIFVTKNGYNDMVIMSAEVYDRIRLVSVYEKLMEAETDIEEGRVLEASASLRKLRERYGL